jgi:O-antigen ligase
LTLAHPILGVGMGVFPVAAADLSQSRGEHPLWLQSHNSYIQVSSETGFPGLALFLSAFAVTGLGLMRLDRTLRRLGLVELRSMCLCVLLAFVALVIHFTFDAIAYGYYLPMIAALGASLIYVARPAILRAERAAETGSAEPALEMQPVGPSARANFHPAAQANSRQTSARNPYRLGRRRVQKRS